MKELMNRRSTNISGQSMSSLAQEGVQQNTQLIDNLNSNLSQIQREKDELTMQVRHLRSEE
ncbi:MAG: hypothetical protein ACMG6E_05495 [Candidatus Roizmanbacteria bacterium]